ncbi:hypothetical protein, partial [Rhodoferax sp. OV413]|uniref:hypothetical protein n=1 Tax=Rhodoferax sp. OV413 TaxID=1855285 RepID=UPI0025FF8362
MVLNVHGKPGQNHDWHGVLWNAFDHTRSRFGWLNAAHRQTVKTNNRAGTTTHVGLRAVGFLAHKRKAMQKLIQRVLATIKGPYCVRSSQPSNWLVIQQTQPSSPGSDKSFFSFGLA